MSEHTDAGLAAWIIGGIGTAATAISALFGHVHWRIGQDRKEVRDDNKAIWTRLDETQRRFMDMPTKADIAELKQDFRRSEDRLLAAINSRQRQV